MTESVDESQSVELGRYWQALRRRWPVVIVGVVVGVVLAGVYLTVVPRNVTATALVNINVISDQPFNNAKSDSDLIDPQTEVQIARSSPVLDAAAKSLGGSVTAASLRRNLTVTPLTAATVVKISFSADSEKKAIAGADDLAAAYLDYRSSAAASKIGKVVDQLTQRRDDLRDELVATNKKLASAKPGSSVAVQASSDRQLINIQLDSLLSQINELSGVDTTGGTLITSAKANAVVISPARKPIVLAGGLLGLVLGLFGALLVQVLDRRLYDAHSIAVAGGGTQLSRLGQDRATIPAGPGDLDAIRSLRERLLVTVPRGGVLAVVDLTTHREPSDVGVNLALSFVETDSPVCLLLPEHPDAFVERVVAALELRPVSEGSPLHVSDRFEGLHVILPEPGDSGDTQLVSLLAKREEDYAITVISLPPTAPRSLRLSAGRLGHSIVLVANRLGTRAGAVTQLSAELEAVEAVVHGSVLVPRRRHLVAGSKSDVESAEPAEAEAADEDDASDSAPGSDDEAADDKDPGDEASDDRAPDDEEPEINDEDADAARVTTAAGRSARGDSD